MSEEPEKSYMTNCYIAGRGDTPFKQLPNGGLLVRANGYAIIPLEELDKHLDNIKKMAKQFKEKL